jgi:hypothetical protein
MNFTSRVPLYVEEEWIKMFYEGKQQFHSTYVVVTLESDITVGNSLDFFLAEHETHIIQPWFPLSLRLKKMFHSTA